MKKMTMNVPVGTGWQKVGEVQIEGEGVGPFVVHREVVDTRVGSITRQRIWVVTHVQTGHAVARDIRNKRRAMWLARKLTAHDWWSFNDPKVVIAFTQEQMAIVKTLVADAKFGDMQGLLAA